MPVLGIWWRSNMSWKQYSIYEIKWLFAIAFICFLVLGILTSFGFKPIEIAVHDSYMIFDMLSLGLMLFLFLGFLLLFLRELVFKFQRVKPLKGLLLFTLFCLILTVTTTVLFASMVQVSGSASAYLTAGGTTNEITVILQVVFLFCKVFVFLGIPLFIVFLLRVKILQKNIVGI